MEFSKFLVNYPLSLRYLQVKDSKPEECNERKVHVLHLLPLFYGASGNEIIYVKSR